MGVPKQLPGLSNFYMAGHWVEPGGTVTLAAASGKNTMQLICNADGKSFETSLPSVRDDLQGNTVNGL
jgi:phytoene dehydrogenase-like protein